jgi:hypothetical protein
MKIGKFIWGLIFGYNEVSFEISTEIQRMFDFWRNKPE